MTILATLSGTVTATADDYAELPGVVEVTDTGFIITVDLDASADIARAQRYQRLGVKVDIDRGDGTMLTMLDKEVANSLTIEESADSFGDTLQLQLNGHRFSPFARALLRAKNKVEVHFTTGSREKRHVAKVFTGWIVSSSFQVQPPLATVTALDADTLYAEKRALDYALAPNHGKSRLAITLELLALIGAPVGYLDFPGGDGGTVTKPVAPGDRPVLDYLRDFLAVIGVEIGFVNGEFTAVRYDSTLPAVLDLNPSNLLPSVAAQAPDTLAPNVSGVVSVSYTRIEPTGLRTVETRVIVTGQYAVMRHESQVGSGFGPGDLPASPHTISEIVTRTSYRGNLDVRTEQTERGWYAARGCATELNAIAPSPTGYELVDHNGTYIYSDGSARDASIETFQVIRRLIQTKTVDSENRVIEKREEQYFFNFRRRALFEVNSSDEDAVIADGIPINDDGQGCVIDSERLYDVAGEPDLRTVTAYDLSDDGTISQERTTETFNTVGNPKPRVEGAYGYGTNPRFYTDQDEERFNGVRTTTIRYRQISEDKYERLTIRKEGRNPATVTTETLIGTMPRPEQAQPEQTGQEIRAEVADAERIAYAGEEIEDIEHNEFIETEEEARAYSVIKARRASAIRLECDMPLEGLVHKFKNVTVTLPNANINGLTFYVRSVTRDAANFSQHVSAEHYPAHIV